MSSALKGNIEDLKVFVCSECMHLKKILNNKDLEELNLKKCISTMKIQDILRRRSWTVLNGYITDANSDD